MDNPNEFPAQDPTPTRFKFSGIAIVLIALVLIGGGLFFFLNRKAAPPVLQASMAPSKSITLDEIAKHTDSSSCWMAIEGKVYDVTGFIPGHPGGDAILQGCGKDATAIFNSRPNDGTSHSDRARSILANYQIGVLAQ